MKTTDVREAQFPPLPEPQFPAILAGLWPNPKQAGYTADQMREYALAALSQPAGTSAGEDGGLRELTTDEAAGIAALREKMQREVIPQIVDVIQQRQQAAASAQDVPLFSAPCPVCQGNIVTLSQEQADAIKCAMISPAAPSQDSAAAVDGNNKE
jgi:hypothetical protein